MRDIKDGEPAFPSPVAVGPAGDVYQGQYFGMSLRDYFAGQFLSGIAQSVSHTTTLYTGQMAVDAYAVADAMLKERTK